MNITLVLAASQPAAHPVLLTILLVLGCLFLALAVAAFIAIIADSCHNYAITQDDEVWFLAISLWMGISCIVVWLLLK
jgi:hypothetical protein